MRFSAAFSTNIFIVVADVHFILWPFVWPFLCVYHWPFVDCMQLVYLCMRGNQGTHTNRHLHIGFLRVHFVHIYFV